MTIHERCVNRKGDLPRKDACKNMYRTILTEGGSPIKAGSVLEGFKRKRVDGNPILRGTGAFSKENIVHDASDSEAELFHLSSLLRPPPLFFNSVRGRARAALYRECTFLSLNKLICIIPEASTTNCLRHWSDAESVYRKGV